jgi:hypothetical protein
MGLPHLGGRVPLRMLMGVCDPTIRYLLLAYGADGNAQSQSGGCATTRTNNRYGPNMAIVLVRPCLPPVRAANWPEYTSRDTVHRIAYAAAKKIR